MGLFQTSTRKALPYFLIFLIGLPVHFTLHLVFTSVKFMFFRIHFLDEYDHLDYNSAGSSFKPHYHRMNDMLNITKEENEVKESNIISNNLDAPGHSLLDTKSTNSSETSNT